MRALSFKIACLALSVTFAGAVDQNLLIDKTWDCKTDFKTDNLAMNTQADEVYHKNGTFEGKGSSTIEHRLEKTKALFQQHYIGNWRIEGDKLITKATSSTVQVFDEKSKKFIPFDSGENDEDYEESINTITGLTKSTFISTVLDNEDITGDVTTVSCKAK